MAKRSLAARLRRAEAKLKKKKAKEAKAAARKAMLKKLESVTAQLRR